MPTIPNPPELNLQPGDRVRVTQTLACRDKVWPTTVEGTVLACDWEETGSWYAHGKNQLYWLTRIRLQKADGEITVLGLDRNSRVEKIEGR